MDPRHILTSEDDFCHVDNCRYEFGEDGNGDLNKVASHFIYAFRKDNGMYITLSLQIKGMGSTDEKQDVSFTPEEVKQFSLYYPNSN